MTFASLPEILLKALGPQEWWPAPTPWQIMVGAVLTQNTTWTAVEKTMPELAHMGVLASPESLLATPPNRIEKAIRPCGFFRQKTKKLFHLAKFLIQEPAINSRPTPALREALRNVWGIGPETADAILCYAFERPIFVVDAYTRRIFSRHGWCHPLDSYGQIQSLVESQCLLNPPHDRGEFHALLVAIGKSFCKASNPLCHQCPLPSPSKPPHFTCSLSVSIGRSP